MRKKFTQYFNLKSFMALMICIGMTSVANGQCDVPPPEGAIYNYQFDGGLDGWRATNIDGDDVDQTGTLPGPGDGTVFGWVWDAEGKVSGGAYNGGNAGATDFVVSPSVCNGAMVFNSDFYDNAGTAGAFGTGVCPSNNTTFCDGLLISPVMDLSGVDSEVVLQFNQGVRQFNSEYYIYLSNNGGISNFDTIQINDDIPTNSGHLLARVERIPLCGARGVEELVITIHYRGYYYYWALDDISILPSVAPDTRVNSNFVAISAQYGTPANMLFGFPHLADIENVSAVEAVAPVLGVTVTDEDDNVIYENARTYDNVPGCMTDENKAMMGLFTPPSKEGFYTTSYILATDGDVNAANDTVAGVFEVTENDFKKVISEEEAGTEYLGGIRYGGGSFQSWGSYFYIPQNAGNQAIAEIRCGLVAAGGQELGVGELLCSVYEWVDVNEDGVVNSGTANEKIRLGGGSYNTIPGATDSRDFSVVPLNDDGEMIVPTPGSNLLVMFHTNPFSGTINYFGLNSDAEDDPSFAYGASSLAYGELLEPVRYGSMGGVGTSPDDAEEMRDFFSETRWTWYLNMSLTPIVGTEDINTNLGVEVYPSPASNMVNVDLNLEVLSPEVSVELVNMSGSRVGVYNYKNIQNDRLSIDVSTLPGGMYLMNIRTEAGMISKKISVVH